MIVAANASATAVRTSEGLQQEVDSNQAAARITMRREEANRIEVPHSSADHEQVVEAAFTIGFY